MALHPHTSSMLDFTPSTGNAWFSMISKRLVHVDFGSKIEFCELNLQNPYPHHWNGKKILDIGTNHWIYMIWYNFKQTGLCNTSSWSLTSEFSVFQIKNCISMHRASFFKSFQINSKNHFFQIISNHFKNSHFANRSAFLGEFCDRSTKLKNENFKKSRNWKISKVWPWPYTHTILPCLISHQVLEMLDFSWFQRSLFM